MQPLVCTVDPFLIILIIFFFNYILLFYSIWLLSRIQSIQNLEDKNLASDRSLMLIDVAWLIKVSPVFFAFFLFCDWSKQQETEISGNKVEVQQKTKFSIKLGLLEWLDKKMQRCIGCIAASTSSSRCTQTQVDSFKFFTLLWRTWRMSLTNNSR